MAFENKGRLTVFDGAIGTEVQKRAPGGSSNITDSLNESAPQIVKDIHLDYLAAGADFLTTNTFSSSPVRLSKSGYEERSDHWNAEGVRLAKESIEKFCGGGKRGRYVAGSMGPSGETLVPFGNYHFDDLFDSFQRQALALAKGGADWIIIETMESLREAKAAFMAARECGLPVISSMSYGDQGRTSYGVEPASAAVTLAGLGADVLGINCGTGPAPYLKLIRSYSKYTDKPLLAEANAGNPKLKKGKVIYEFTPEEYLEDIKPGLPYLTGVGSCCGSDPDFTRLLSKIAPEYPNSISENESVGRQVASSSKVSPLDSRQLVEVEVELDELSVVKEQLHPEKINLLNIKAYKESSTDLESLLAKTFLQLRSSEPIGLVTNDADLLKGFLKAYPGLPPVSLTNNSRSLGDLTRRFGGVVL